MANNSGKQGLRRLANMATVPVDEMYQAPPRSECDDWFWSVDDGESIIEFRTWSMRGKVADFCIEQYVTVASGRAVVARIDCARGTVHRHLYDRSGDPLIDHELIGVIPLKDSWDAVDAWYTECYELMIEEAEANLRRWRDG